MSSPEPEDCIESLDEWIISNKNMIYDENIKSPNNSQEVLENYTNTLETFANKLIRAINREDEDILSELGWPQELLVCIKDLSVRAIIVYRVEHWFIRYPFIKSKFHLNELEAENAGVN